jgi:hypothetical protein
VGPWLRVRGGSGRRGNEASGPSSGSTSAFSVRLRNGAKITGNHLSVAPLVSHPHLDLAHHPSSEDALSPRPATLAPLRLKWNACETGLTVGCPTEGESREQIRDVSDVLVAKGPARSPEHHAADHLTAQHEVSHEAVPTAQGSGEVAKVCGLPDPRLAEHLGIHSHPAPGAPGEGCLLDRSQLDFVRAAWSDPQEIAAMPWPATEAADIYRRGASCRNGRHGATPRRASSRRTDSSRMKASPSPRRHRPARRRLLRRAEAREGTHPRGGNYPPGERLC